MRRKLITTTLAVFLAATAFAADTPAKPNILLIYADDMGFGEVSAYNPERNKVPTPHIDRLAALDESGLADNTLVIFTTDNGTAPYIGVSELEAKGHFPSGPLRGYKADVWEGGHRVPFIVRWPGVVKAGSVSDHLVHQTDLMRTFADIFGAELPDNAGEDSFSLLPLLKGVDQPVREHAVSHSLRGLPSLRRGSWKMIFGPGSGGWSKSTAEHPAQLYNLADDIGESRNLYAEKPEIVAELVALMERLVAEGRSTPGPKQKNDVAVRGHLGFYKTN